MIVVFTADPAAAREATENLAKQAQASLKGLTIEEARTVLNLKDLKDGIDATEVKEVCALHHRPAIKYQPRSSIQFDVLSVLFFLAIRNSFTSTKQTMSPRAVRSTSNPRCSVQRNASNSR